MLGPEIETFRGNRATMLAWALIIGGIAFWIYSALTLTNRDREIYFGVVLAIIALILGWLASIHLTIHTDGVSYKSWFGSKEIRHEMLERFYFSSVRRSVNFIPIGTYYTFRLTSSEGTKIRFGNRVGRLGALTEKLVEATYPTLFKKAAEKFNRGEEVDFGDVKLSKAGGIRIKRSGWGGFGSKFVDIPWNEVHSYNIQKGHFYVWKQGEKRTTGPSLTSVANAFVMKGLLDNLFGAQPAAVEPR